MIAIHGEAEAISPGGAAPTQDVPGNGAPAPAHAVEPPAPESPPPGAAQPRTAPPPHPPHLPQTVLGAVMAVSIDAREVGTSVGVLFLWLALLAAGITVSTQPYIDLIRNTSQASPAQVAGALLVITLCHTATNIALLCCLSAFLGVIGSRSVSPLGSGADPGEERMSAYVAAATRGFFVYLVMQSGAVVLSEQPFHATSLEQYVRLAALASLISFAVGYNPGLFQNLLTRVNALTAGDRRADTPGRPAPR